MLACLLSSPCSLSPPASNCSCILPRMNSRKVWKDKDRTGLAELDKFFPSGSEDVTAEYISWGALESPWRFLSAFPWTKIDVFSDPGHPGNPASFH